MASRPRRAEPPASSQPKRTRLAAAAKAVAYHRGNVADDLKTAAKRLLKVERLEDISARRLCREVGVASANFYNHFEKLDDLLLEIAADGFEERALKNRRIRSRAGSHEEALIEIALSTVEFAIEERELFRLMFGQVSDREGHKRYIAASQAAFDVLVEAVINQPREPGKRPPEAFAFFAFINGLARVISQNMASNFTGTRKSRREFVEAVTRAYITGIKL